MAVTIRNGQVALKNFPWDHLVIASREGGIGLCRACGKEADAYIEPDARNYLCEACGYHQIFGAQELIIMGCVDDA